MGEIKFRQADGEVASYPLEPGLSIMELAVKNDVDGIIAECGGAAACATCHVFLDESWDGRVPPKNDQEEAMLEFAVDTGPCSRLGCQIPLGEEHDGLTVELPESQF